MIVHFRSDGFQMTRIATTTVKTEMVDLMPLRDQSHFHFIDNAIGVTHSSPFILGDGIAFDGSARTRPALVRIAHADARQKASHKGFGRTAARVHVRGV